MRKLVLLLALALGANSALADNGWFYVGASIAQTNLHDIAPGGVSLGNIDTTSWKVLAGMRPVSFFAVEADYTDLGSRTVNPNPEFRAHISYEAFAAYGVGFLPIPLPYLDVYGKAGLARWSSSGSRWSLIIPPTQSFSDSGTAFAWGAGAQIHVGRIGARLEYESFHIPSTSGAKVVSLVAFLNVF